MESNVRLCLYDDQYEKMKEMIKWLFKDHEVTSNFYETYTITKVQGSSNICSYVNYLNALLFLIPTKLGMDFVVVDPENPQSIFEQVYEKYMIYTNTSEKSCKKSKYRSTYEQGFFDGCSY